MIHVPEPNEAIPTSADTGIPHTVGTTSDSPQPTLPAGDLQVEDYEIWKWFVDRLNKRIEAGKHETSTEHSLTRGSAKHYRLAVTRYLGFVHGRIASERSQDLSDEVFRAKLFASPNALIEEFLYGLNEAKGQKVVWAHRVAIRTIFYGWAKADGFSKFDPQIDPTTPKNASAMLPLTPAFEAYCNHLDARVSVAAAAPGSASPLSLVVAQKYKATCHSLLETFAKHVGLQGTYTEKIEALSRAVSSPDVEVLRTFLGAYPVGPARYQAHSIVRDFYTVLRSGRFSETVIDALPTAGGVEHESGVNVTLSRGEMGLPIRQRKAREPAPKKLVVDSDVPVSRPPVVSAPRRPPAVPPPPVRLPPRPPAPPPAPTVTADAAIEKRDSLITQLLRDFTLSEICELRFKDLRINGGTVELLVGPASSQMVREIRGEAVRLLREWWRILPLTPLGGQARGASESHLFPALAQSRLIVAVQDAAPVKGRYWNVNRPMVRKWEDARNALIRSLIVDYNLSFKEVRGLRLADYRASSLTVGNSQIGQNRVVSLKPHTVRAVNSYIESVRQSSFADVFDLGNNSYPILFLNVNGQPLVSDQLEE